jgi:hypothetical protein
MKVAMKKQALMILSFIFCLKSFSQPADNCKKDSAAAPVKTPIALLGVYHFSNPNLDQFNVKSDNVLTEKRQKELEELVKRLAEFKPTRIALEFDRKRNNADSLYQQYLKGERSLSTNEAEQIGFRLAKYLRLPHVYGVDERNIEVDFNPGQLAVEFAPLLEQLSKTGNEIIGRINSWINQYTIGGVLSRLNQPEMDRLNLDIYYRFLLPIGKDTLQPGVTGVTNWYKRNLFVFHHIKEIIKKEKNEKVLVIFGQGHTAMLKQFLQYSSEYELVDIQQFLPPVLESAKK